jgi:hypothetical protein
LRWSVAAIIGALIEGRFGRIMAAFRGLFAALATATRLIFRLANIDARIAERDFFGGAAQSIGQIRAQIGERQIITARSANQHMIGALDARFWKNFTHQSPQSALHPITGHGVANFFADGIANAQRFILIAAFADKQDKAGHGEAKAAISG